MTQETPIRTAGFAGRLIVTLDCLNDKSQFRPMTGKIEPIHNSNLTGKIEPIPFHLTIMKAILRRATRCYNRLERFKPNHELVFLKFKCFAFAF